jgi:DNA-binding CsgD family transcriptional regulator
MARARALYSAAWAASRQEYTEATWAFAQECMAICRAHGEPQLAGRAMCVQAQSAICGGNLVAATAMLQKSVAIAREVGDRWGLASALGQLGAALGFQGDYSTARAFREESIAEARAIGDWFTLDNNLAGLALLARERGDHVEACALFKQTLKISSDIEHLWVLARALTGLAGAAKVAHDHEKAARLLGAAQAVRDRNATRELLPWRAVFDPDVAVVRTALGDEAFAAAWAAGRAMSLGEVTAYALSDAGYACTPDHKQVSMKKAAPGRLTQREQEVAALLAKGSSNREIAATLIIANSTAERHVANILNKLGLGSRVEVAVWAVESCLHYDR